MKQFLKSLFLIILVPMMAFGRCKVQDSYHGVRITAHTLYDLMPTAPRALKIQVDTWLNQLSGSNVVDRLAQFSDATQWKNKWQRDKQMMADLGLKNLSSDSYVAQVPGTNYLFKVAGPKHRVLSMLATKGDDDERLIEDEHLLNQHIQSRLQGDIFATYQTASRAAYFLLVKQLLEKQNFQYVVLPHTYLRYLPGHKKDVSDANVMLLQEYVPEQTKLKKRPEMIALLPNRALEELYEVVVTTGVWDIKDDILINAQGQLVLPNSLHLIGFNEYPNTSSKDFFNKNHERFCKNQALGLKSLMQLVAGHEDKVAFIKSLIENDKRLCACGSVKGFLRYLFNCVSCGCSCERVQDLLDYEPRGES